MNKHFKEGWRSECIIANIGNLIINGPSRTAETFFGEHE